MPSDPLPFQFPFWSVGSLIYPDCSGTAFVVEILDNGNNENNPIAIVATAAYIYYNAFSETKNKHRWLFTFEGDLDPTYHLCLELSNAGPSFSENSLRDLRPIWQAFWKEYQLVWFATKRSSIYN